MLVVYDAVHTQFALDLLGAISANQKHLHWHWLLPKGFGCWYLISLLNNSKYYINLRNTIPNSKSKKHNFSLQMEAKLLFQWTNEPIYILTQMPIKVPTT